MPDPVQIGTHATAFGTGAVAGWVAKWMRDRKARRIADALKVEAAQDGLVVVEGPQGVIREANLAACQFWGISREELIGRTYESLSIPDSTELAVDDDRYAELHAGQIDSYEVTKPYRHQTSGATTYARIRPMIVEREFGEDGKVKRSWCVVSIKDVTRQRRLEAEIIRQREEVDRLRRAVSRYEKITKAFKVTSDLGLDDSSSDEIPAPPRGADDG